jgi:hypothetical protein
VITAHSLPSMRHSELEQLFRDAPAGEIPVGRGRGQALMAGGTRASRPLLAAVRTLAWQGKEFDDRTGTLRNLISPFGKRAIMAEVYLDASRIDGLPCIVLDYSKTSRVAGFVRDEIREVSPGLYLGVVFVRSRRAPVMFSLEFERVAAAARPGPSEASRVG